MEQRNFITVAKPPPEVFVENSFGYQEHLERPVQGNLFEKVEYPESGGIFVHYYDHPFPTKGQPFPEAVDATNMAKKFIRSHMHFASHHPILIAIFLSPTLVSNRYVAFILGEYIRSNTYDMIAPYLLADNRWCRSGREILRAGLHAIDAVKSRWSQHYIFILKVIVSVWEWDNAYRYRGQDIFGELNKEAFFANPFAEIGRLMTLQVRRERGWFEDKGKAIAFGRVLRTAFLFSPELRKLLMAFVQEVNIEEVKLDQSDDYYNLFRPDYDVHGLPIELRQRKAAEILNQYYQEFPNRRQEGMERVEQEKIMQALNGHIQEVCGMPVIMFYATREGLDGKVNVKLVETKLSKSNPHLRESCRLLLTSKESRVKNDQPNEPGGTI